MIQAVGGADSDGDLDDLLQSSFDLIADATCALAGFTAVCLMVRQGRLMRNVAISGSADARARLLGETLPLTALTEALPRGIRHGRYVFLPAGGGHAAHLDEHSWVPPIEASDDPERWQPQDTLVAPLLDEAGDLVGALSLDLPVDGRRPQGEDWDRLQVYAEQARNGLLTVLERLQIAQQLHQLESARDLIRAAIHVSNEQAADEPLEQVLRRVGATLLTHFGLCSAWFHVFGGPGLSSITLDACGPRELPLELGFVPYGETIARRLWAAQELGILGRSQRTNVDETNAEAVGLAAAYLERYDVDSMLYAPLGLGAECLGLVILLRPGGAPPWTDVEREAIIEIGRDLGGLIAGVFARERDAEVLTDLRALETYKSEMVSTISHELKNPLAAIRTNLELLEDAATADEATHVLGAVRRSTSRMAAIVADLQGVGTAGGNAHRGMRSVDLATTVRDACVASQDSGTGSLRITLALPEGPVRVFGAPTQLDRLVGNLLSNAVKYSSTDGEIRVSLDAVDDEAVLTVADEGIGISAADQALLFTEFFRSNNAEALLQPGTGLGLAIVRRIVERHGGRVEVASRLGEGSTFCVHLPLEDEVR